MGIGNWCRNRICTRIFNKQKLIFKPQSISDYAQHQLGNVVYVDLPEVDDELNQGEEFGAVESVKAASDLLSPISGIVVEINDKLEDKPELLNEDAFGNWICKVKINDKAELDSLMNAEAYKAICE